MKIMIVGAWQWVQYEQAFACGLKNCGVEVKSFSTSRFFRDFVGRAQLALPVPAVAFLRLNFELIYAVKKDNPDYILFWRPTHILPSVLRTLSKLGIRTISYNNDDPFGPKFHGNVPWHHHFHWYWYLKCLPYFDFNFFYRKINCEEGMALGARRAEVMLPYFMGWKDRPLELSAVEMDRFETDVVFVGHYENDGRVKNLQVLIDANIKLKVWGGRYWTRDVLGDAYEYLQPIVPAEGDDYAKALNGAKICLAFLSKLNRDTYTRRCFEIPACGRVLLAERTRDLQDMFEEDKEACLFSSCEELLVKVQWLINNPEERERIAKAGQQRVWSDGHEVTSRAKQFLYKITKTTGI